MCSELHLPYVASFSGLSIFDCPFLLCTLCCQFLWIVHLWLPRRLVYPMLPVSLDCSSLIAPSSCVPYVASFSGLSMQHRVHKTKKNKKTTQYVLVRRKLIIKQQEPLFKPGVNGSKQFHTFFLLKVILKTHHAYLRLQTHYLYLDISRRNVWRKTCTDSLKVRCRWVAVVWYKG
jgi:hypothetical protein